MLLEEDFTLYMRRLQFVINRPSPVYGSVDPEYVFAYLSILKQCVLLNN